MSAEENKTGRDIIVFLFISLFVFIFCYLLYSSYKAEASGDYLNRKRLTERVVYLFFIFFIILVIVSVFSELLGGDWIQNQVKDFTHKITFLGTSTVKVEKVKFTTILLVVLQSACTLLLSLYLMLTLRIIN